ncbi:MAG: hypothetical protein Q8P80_02510 [Candidatus Levybacteria bacterium]|nr:hypothetical protein [Candidatus Levybacteria bacterium]
MIKKFLTYSLITILLFVRTAGPIAVYAEDVTPTPTPDLSSTQIDNSSTTSNGIDSSADTGNNAINPTPTPTIDPSIKSDTPTPTPTPDVSPTVDPTPTPDLTSSSTPIPDPGVTATGSASSLQANSADLTNSTDSTAITGENAINSAGDSSSSDNSGQSSSTTDTGNALSSAAVENSVNTTNINSQLINQTVNLFIAQDGSLDLSDPYKIVSEIIPAHAQDPVINVSVVSVNNYSYLSNDIVSFANTGNNQINSDGTAIINTGNAYSMVSLLNQVNFTLVNSTIHIVTINIFGELNGNIILPDSQNGGENCSGCGINLAIDNQASVDNNTNSSAITGQNSITTSGSGDITTGDAKSAVNNLNVVNTNLVGVNALVLFINNQGTWDGSFVGWGNFDPQSGGASMVFMNISPNGQADCPSCVGSLSVQNQALVSNNVSSTANTGGNNINAGNGTINTGKAYSAVSIFNFINSTFVNSRGFFGFINIFGRWTGNVGGKSNFETDTVASTNTGTEQTGSEQNQQKEIGGQLSVTQKNNVGEHVMPGDTVTFFVNVKNTGSGKVYDAHLNLYLVKDGKNVGGTTFNLGDIGVGKSVKLSTGLVLSASTPGGVYSARTDVTGTVGPDDSEVFATAGSQFEVYGATATTSILDGTNTGPESAPKVLGAVYKNNKNTQNEDQRLLYILIITVSGYIAIRAVRERENLVKVFQKGSSIESRMRSLRLFLI